MKAINTLNIELAQLEERVKGINERMDGYKTLIQDDTKLLDEYIAQVEDLKAALEKLK